MNAMFFPKKAWTKAPYLDIKQANTMSSFLTDFRRLVCTGLAALCPVLVGLDVIHGFLKSAYWCENLPRVVIERAIRHSLCFGVYRQGRQVGFARVVTDYATTAYVGDVFIRESYRGRGLGKRLIKAVVDHPALEGLRLWLLGTKDAHSLYRKFGFKKVAEWARVEKVIT